MTTTKHASTTTAILYVSVLLVVSQVMCRAADMPAKLTVADAVAIALRSNANLKEAHASYLDAASQLKVQKFLTTYDVGSSLNLQRNQGQSDTANLVSGSWKYRGLAGAEASLDMSPFGTGNTRGGLDLQLRRPLGSGSGMFSNKADLVESARVSATLQYKSLYLARQSKVQDVVQAYYGAVLARERVAVVEGALTIAKQAAEDARTRLKEELVAEIDVSRADIRVAENEDQLNQQRQQARAAVDQLMMAMGLGVGNMPELVDPLPEPTVPTVTLSDAIKIALANRSELAQYDIRIPDQQRKLAIRNDRLRPKLDAVAGFNSTNTNSGLLSSSITDFSTMTAGLEYRIPLDSRALVEERETAARDLETMKAQRDLQAESVAQEVRNAFRTMEESKATVDIFTENLKVAEKGLFLASRMFEEGLRDNRDVLDAQQDLARIKNDILSAKTALYLAGLNLRYAMGEDLTATEAK